MLDKNVAQVENLLHFLRGYIIPSIGGLVFVLLLIFVYMPNIFNIFTDVSNMQAVNAKYDQAKNRILYFKNLSSSDKQIQLTDNLLAINSVLPDQAKDADSINLIQTLAQNDGMQVLSATGNVLDQVQGQASATQYSKLLKVSNITFSITGSVDQAEKLFHDISNEKQLAAITDLSMQGGLSTGSQVTLNLTVNMFSLDSSQISKAVDIYNNVNTSYTTDYINGL